MSRTPAPRYGCACSAETAPLHSADIRASWLPPQFVFWLRERCSGRAARCSKRSRLLREKNRCPLRRPAWSLSDSCRLRASRGCLSGRHHSARVLRFSILERRCMKRTSAGASKERGSRNPFVFHAPNAMPAAIQADPRILPYAEIPPQPQADEKLINGTIKFHKAHALLHEIVHEGRRVDSHECQERAIIQQPDSLLEGQKYAPISTIAPINRTLFCGMPCLASTFPKNDFGSALLFPIP